MPRYEAVFTVVIIIIIIIIRIPSKYYLFSLLYVQSFFKILYLKISFSYCLISTRGARFPR